MKIIGLVGSPRAGGNTDLLVGAALEGARESGAKVEKILVKNLQIDTCEGCLACWQSGFCDRFDDDLPWLVEQLSEADGLVLGSPVWSGFLPGSMKNVFDRLTGPATIIEATRVLSRLPQKRRNGLSIAVCATPALQMAEAAVIFLNYNLQLHANGGEVNEIRATGLMARGQVGLDVSGLTEMYKQMGLADAVKMAVGADKGNRDLLARAREAGSKLV
ncbi:MAG: flavodoxin family protein [Bacillota bacterium]|jgi:NAD(P)H-dependent FMN reductase